MFGDRVAKIHFFQVKYYMQTRLFSLLRNFVSPSIDKRLYVVSTE